MKITLNPVFSIETGALLSHDGIFDVESIPIRFDRSAQKQAKNLSSADKGLAGGFWRTASDIGSTLIPGLERESTNPVGLTPEQRNTALVSGAEAIGGVNSGVKGLGALETSRTKNAGGFAPALDEAARIKGRQLATNAQDVTKLDTSLANEKQRFAQGELGNLYAGLNADQLKAMGLSDEAINTMIKGGQSGWFQNLTDYVSAEGKAAQGAAAMGA